MKKDSDVKQTTVERQTNDLMKSSHGRLSSEQAKRIARDSAERVNRARHEGK